MSNDALSISVNVNSTPSVWLLESSYLKKFEKTVYFFEEVRMDEKVHEGKLVYGHLNAHRPMPDYLVHRSPQIPSRMLPQAQGISANQVLAGDPSGYFSTRSPSQ